MVAAVLFAWGGTLVHQDDEVGVQLASTSHALFEALRRRGLRLAVVTNGAAEDADRLGVTDRVDAVVRAKDVGAAKPSAEIFARALDLLGAESYDAVFVGDRIHEDVRGAGEVGMTTVQALWFRADESGDGLEPDFLAFTQMDVLNIVDRLSRE